MTRKPTTPPDPAVKRIIDLYHDEFSAKFGFKPDPRSYGRFGKEVKQLLATWGEADVVATLREFFLSRDTRIVRSDYTAMAFLSLAQYLRTRMAGHQELDHRTAANIEAAERAIGHKPEQRKLIR